MLFRRYRLQQKCLYAFTILIFITIVIGAFYLLPGTSDNEISPGKFAAVVEPNERRVIEPVDLGHEVYVNKIDNEGVVRHIVKPQPSEDEKPVNKPFDAGLDQTGLDAEKRDKVVEVRFRSC